MPQSRYSIFKKEHSYEVFITIDDTDQTHILTSAPDLIIQFDPTNVLISAATVYIIFSAKLWNKFETPFNTVEKVKEFELKVLNQKLFQYVGKNDVWYLHFRYSKEWFKCNPKPIRSQCSLSLPPENIRKP